MKITDVRCALIGKNPIVRILTDEGLDGLGQIESSKPYVKPHVLHLGELLIGADPTDVERTMLRIRQRGAFKPWGAAVSAIEHALWDLAGKAAGLPVHKLLGGKVRDRVLVYNGNKRQRLVGQTPEDYAESARRMKAEPEKFRIVKQGIAFHSGMKHDVPNFMYGIANPVSHHYQVTRGLLTERGLRHIVECVEAMKEVLGEDVGLALDCGPGFVLPDAIRLAKALEHLNILWLEDTLTGDYIPYVDPDVYRELTVSTTIPIHTGEQIYLRNNFKALIETNAVRIVGPDPCDVGGIAELKWVAEHAALHGVLIAPQGTLNGVVGLAALVQVCATLPDNYIAFEYPTGDPEWWYEIVDGIPTVEDGTIEVGTRPGLGVTFRIDEAKRYLLPEDAAFFD